MNSLTAARFAFSEANESDIPDMAELCFAAYKKKICDRHAMAVTETEKQAYLAERRARLQDDFLDNDFVAFIIRDKNVADAPCGVLSLFMPDKHGKGFIQDLYAVSGGKTGDAGLARAKEILKDNGASGIDLHANPSAVGFYQRNGFRNISADKNVYLMHCDL